MNSGDGKGGGFLLLSTGYQFQVCYFVNERILRAQSEQEPQG